MTKDELVLALVLERFGPPPLPPAAPPHAVDLALAVPAAPPPPEPGRRHGHLVVLDGGPNTTAA